MKSLKQFTVITVLAFIIIMESTVYAYNDCPMADWYSNASPPAGFIGGYLKPQRTDSAEGVQLSSTASFPVIIVFVQFPDEDLSTDNTEWPIGLPPAWKDSLLSSVRKNDGNFWDRYDEKKERLSDYYQEVSRGQFHMTGITRHYIFDHNRSWYNSNATTMNNEVYSKLQSDTSIHWSDFDKWQFLSFGNFRYEGDGNLDMLMMVRRTNSGDAGFAGLDGSNFEIDPVNHITIRTGFSQFGSGSVIQGNLGNPPQPNSNNRMLGIILHEYGHYLLSESHSNIGLMTSRGGNSINDLFYSPFEKFKLGYINPKTVNFTNNSSYAIGDISCRTTNNEVLKVPINSTEYLLIENRRKISKYDVKMLGDTTRLEMSFNSGEYGKGIYIYHIQSVNNQYSHEQDQECADGIWDWEVSGTAIPDWSESGTLPLLKRTILSNPINNDNGNWGSLNNKDGISANYNGGAGVYFSLGKRNTAVGLRGTDKIFTNYPEFWTSRELWGDRLDAWNISYNEIFSPYSNPNTKDWTNTKTGIFIYYYCLNDGIAKLKVYKENDPFTETEILAITPPSKPMGINVDYYTETENYIRPIITWNHNQEPDMLRPDSLKKRYYIWRATNQNMTVVPVDYSLLDTVDIDSDTTPSYIDHSVFGYGSSWPGMGQMEQYPIRYTVQAVDKYDDVSVRSDFGMAIGIKNCTQCIGVVEDHLMNEPLPAEYSLNQNFPNPFNPETKIQYALPEDNYVTIKIYDVLGKEVITLINEFRSAGRYNVTFNGENFSSGIYYYKIESGNFSQVRKMLLIR